MSVTRIAISAASGGYSGSSYSPQRQQLEPPALPFQRSAATPGLTQDSLPVSRPSQQSIPYTTVRMQLYRLWY